MDERERKDLKVSRLRSRQQGMDRRPGSSVNRPGNMEGGQDAQKCGRR